MGQTRDSAGQQVEPQGSSEAVEGIGGKVLQTRDGQPLNMPVDLPQAREFSGKVGHDLNNAIMIIQGGAHFLQFTAEPDSDEAEILSQIAEACKRAEDLTKLLLQFALEGRSSQQQG